MLGYKSAKFLPINFIGISPNSAVQKTVQKIGQEIDQKIVETC